MDPAMDWQGKPYRFLGVHECWRHLGVTNFDDFRTWRANYPVTVAVLDTGIMVEHEAFKHLRDAGPGAIQGQYFMGNNQIGQNIAPPDNNAHTASHGTQCAAIIAGGEYNAVQYNVQSNMLAQSLTFWNGVAPFVNLYFCKIDLNDSSMIAAINHLMEEKKEGRLQVDVICMSLNGKKFNAALEKCIQEASLNNIIVVCSACNEGRRSSNSVQYPASLGSVICVGSHNIFGHESSFTAVGREIDILGPGEIKSAYIIPNTPPGQFKNAIVEDRGTSYAAPFVAGIVAIILANAQRIDNDGHLRKAISNNVVMKQILREMASEPGDHTQSRGHGSLDPLRIFDFSDHFFCQIVGSITSTHQQDEDYKLRNYDLRKVATNMTPPDQLLQDVEFASTMESIILRLPEQAEEGGMPRPMGYEQGYHQYPDQNISDTPANQPKHLNLKVFRDKITADKVTKISCLSLPSPSDAAYGDKKGSAALKEFLTQLGGDLVNSVEDLWLYRGTAGEDKLKFSDIKEILQTLQELKSPNSRKLTVHCEKVDFSNVTADTADCSYICQINPSILKVIIHPRDENWSSVFARVTAKVPNYVPACIEECSPVCCPHCSSVSKQAASCNQPGIEDMACDISLKKLTYASRDEMAAVHAPILKYKDKLKGNVHVTVAVLGSGICIDHELDKDIKVTQIIKDKACFVPQESWDLSVDTLGIGTALASVATSFAPAQTQLLTAKVMDEQGRSNPVWVARAVDWAANHGTYPADVILIPVGFEKFDHRLYKAVTEAQKNGKIVIAAAARSTEAREISYPARHGDVICVGSHSRVGSHPSFGVKGREMDFLMMGEQHPVKAASAKGSNKYSSVSGTSVAAAMATAVVSFTLLYAESVGGNNLRDQLKSNTMIRELLREACSSRGFHTPDRGYGTLDPDRLFKWGPQHFKELVKKITGT